MNKIVISREEMHKSLSPIGEYNKDLVDKIFYEITKRESLRVMIISSLLGDSAAKAVNMLVMNIGYSKFSGRIIGYIMRSLGFEVKRRTTVRLGETTHLMAVYGSDIKFNDIEEVLDLVEVR